MTIGTRSTTRALTDAEVHGLLAEALEQADLRGKRVLVVIPDRTRTAPMGQLHALFAELLAPQVAVLDYLVALGTHPPLDDAGLSALLGTDVVGGSTGRSRVLNHRWDLPETFVTLGTIPAPEVAAASGGRLELDVPVRLNRLLVDPGGWPHYDQLVVVGPVFPHEVAGFSGGNKYFVPGVAGEEVIHVTHWLGALLTSRALIGTTDTPVRRMIDRAASFIPTPRLLVALVMHGEALHGVFVGDMARAWREAAALSAELDIVRVERPFRRALAVVPEMYDELWTAAKGMYKLEPAMADGGEVVILAPHLGEVSTVHGTFIDRIGYHVRDYFLADWERFRHIPWGVLAHSTHLCGDGTYVDGVERPRVRVTLASQVPPERCASLGLGYLDPATVDPEEWADREDEGVLLVRRAGEILYRLAAESEPMNAGDTRGGEL
jgi:nickel-dependent lactate racemase